MNKHNDAEELAEWRNTFSGLTAQEVSLMLARAQLAAKANHRLLASIEAYKENYRKMNKNEITEVSIIEENDMYP